MITIIEKLRVMNHIFTALYHNVTIIVFFYNKTCPDTDQWNFFGRMEILNYA